MAAMVPIDVENMNEVVHEGPPPLNLQTLLAGPPEVIPDELRTVLEISLLRWLEPHEVFTLFTYFPNFYPPVPAMTIPPETEGLYRGDARALTDGNEWRVASRRFTCSDAEHRFNVREAVGLMTFDENDQWIMDADHVGPQYWLVRRVYRSRQYPVFRVPRVTFIHYGYDRVPGT